jgi:hypothetical protein
MMVARAQVAGDQLNLLARGWKLAAEGELVPYGNPQSGGGNASGALTSLLVGLPLLVWRDHRAPVVLVALSHVAAYALLAAVARRALSARERLLFGLLYWASPWRLYFSGFLWNPNYLFLAGAVHLWTTWRQRRGGAFLASALHALALALALQLHASAVLLVLASAFLLWRGYFTLHRWGAIAGIAAGCATLVPWLQAVVRDPSLWPVREGFLGHGLVTVQPVLRGIGYWLRYGSFCLGRKMARLDLEPALGADVASVAGPVLVGLLIVLCALTLAAAVAANVRLARRCRPLLARRRAAAHSERSWLEGYVVWTAAAALAGFALAPTTVMSWQALVVFHAAVLPLVAWGEEQARRRPTLFRRAVGAHVAASLLLAVALALANPQYRCGGRGDLHFPLHADHPMLHELGIHRTCPWPIDPERDWFPDVLVPPS